MEASGSLWTTSTSACSLSCSEKGGFYYGGKFPMAAAHSLTLTLTLGTSGKSPTLVLLHFPILGLSRGVGSTPVLFSSTDWADVSVSVICRALNWPRCQRNVSKIPNQGEQALSSTCTVLMLQTNLPKPPHFSQWAHFSAEQNFSKHWLKSYINHLNYLVGKLIPLVLTTGTGIQC